MKKTVWSIGVTAILFLKTEAQPIQLGLVYGQGITTLTKNYVFPTNQMAYHSGLWIAYPKTKHFSIFSGLQYQFFQSRGSFSTYDNRGYYIGEENRYLNFHYLSIPLELDYNINFKRVKPFVGFGANLNLLLSATNTPASNFIQTNVTRNFQPYNISSFVTAGIQGKLSTAIHWRAALVYQQGLLNIGTKKLPLSIGMYRAEVGLGININ